MQGADLQPKVAVARRCVSAFLSALGLVDCLHIPCFPHCTQSANSLHTLVATLIRETLAPRDDYDELTFCKDHNFGHSIMSPNFKQLIEKITALVDPVIAKRGGFPRLHAKSSWLSDKSEKCRTGRIKERTRSIWYQQTFPGGRASSS